MSGSNRLGIKGAIASLIAVGALCTGSFAQNENCPNPKGGNCFEATPGIPGCQEEACCNIVCDINPDCCSVEWEQFCADLALEVCVCDVCGLPQCEDCFVDHGGGTPYCNDECSGEECAGCCLTICALDPYCCNVDWDGLCVGEAEEFCLCKPDEIPINDDCKAAIDVGEGVHNFTTVCSTHDGTDPEVGPCWDGFTGIAADVWFLYTATITGPVRIHTCGGQADFDSKLAVYEGCVVCPPTEESLIECNDNACGDGSEVILEVVAGNCYTVRLGGGYLSPSGSGTFTIESILPPVNDNCADAFVIGLGDTLPFNTTAATTDGSPSPVCDFGAGGDIDNDIWYEFTPDEDGTYVVSLCGSTFDTKLAVYEGCGCPPAADPIACNDDECGEQSLITIDLVAFTCYKIRVGGFLEPGAGAAGGVGKISVFSPPAGFDFFFDQVSFDAAVSKAGKVLKGTEDFSENVLGKNGIDGLDDPLDINSSAPGTFPDGILIDNLTFQANTGGADSTVPAPHTPNNPDDEGLVLVTAPSNDVTADAVLANFFVDGYDILSGPPAGDSHTALGLTLVSLDGSPSVTVTVYDDSNVLLGTMASVPADLDGSSFFGILATEGNTIGRVNIFDPTDGAEGVYDVTAYVAGGSPCPWDLDDNGSVGGTDLLSLLVNWGPYEPCPPFKPADFDQNCSVGGTDLLALLVNWGPCP